MNPSFDSEWIKEHPELKFYNDYCARKVVNMFNNEYPCNCRELIVDRPNTDEFTQNILKLSMFIIQI